MKYSFDQNGSTPSAYEAHSDGQVSYLLEILITIPFMSRYISGKCSRDDVKFFKCSYFYVTSVYSRQPFMIE